MATMRFRWGLRGYVAIGVLTVAVATAIGYRGETFDGVVIRVIDGDTIAFKGDQGEVTVRLQGIDAPELDQAWGLEAKAAAARLCLGEKVHVSVVDVDRYKRRVCDVRLPDDRDLANELVRIGAAWWHPQYAPRDYVKKGLQIQARTSKIGLWSHPPSVEPWTHRHGLTR